MHRMKRAETDAITGSSYGKRKQEQQQKTYIFNRGPDLPDSDV